MADARGGGLKRRGREQPVTFDEFSIVKYISSFPVRLSFHMNGVVLEETNIFIVYYALVFSFGNDIVYLAVRLIISSLT